MSAATPMGAAAAPQTARAEPPLDTVLFWLTAAVERDYEARGAFPALRRSTAQGFRAASTLHYLSTDEAAAVLADALAKRQSDRRGIGQAYKALVKSLQSATEEAVARPALFAAPRAQCLHKSDSRESWFGTKQQLQAHGIQLTGPWPSEPGGKERYAVTRDSRGYKTNITRFSSIWAGAYLACIQIPYEVWGAKFERKSKPISTDADAEAAQRNVQRNVAAARRNLAEVPTSADDFRRHVVQRMREMIRIPLDLALEPADYHGGYTLDEDAVGEIHASFDAVVEAVVGARVKFDQARHTAIIQRYRAAIAAGDQTFQAQVAALTRPNPRILEEGGAR